MTFSERLRPRTTARHGGAQSLYADAGQLPASLLPAFTTLNDPFFITDEDSGAARGLVTGWHELGYGKGQTPGDINGCRSFEQTKTKTSDDIHPESSVSNCSPGVGQVGSQCSGYPFHTPMKGTDGPTNGPEKQPRVHPVLPTVAWVDPSRNLRALYAIISLPDR